MKNKLRYLLDKPGSALRIVQVVNTLSVADGGPARNSFELNKALNGRGTCSADLFWLTGTVEESVLFMDGIEVTDLPFPGPRKISLVSKPDRRHGSLALFIATLWKADVVIIHGYYLFWMPLVVILGRLCRCRVFLMPHGALTMRQQNYSKKAKALFEIAGGKFARLALNSFVTGSKLEREELIGKFATARVKVAGVGVPLPREHKKGQKPHDPLRLLSMSRIAEKKRIDLSIDAIAELKKAGVHAVLTVAGDGSLSLVDSLKSHAESVGVADQIDFIGQVGGSSKVSAFLESDLFILPSEDENFGIGFAEASSFGLPCVVSTNVAAATGMPRAAGILVSAPTGETLAHAILELLEPDEYLKAQIAVRAFAVERFSWPAAADLWLDAMASASSDS